MHGRDGIRIPESGLAVPISISELALESAGTAVLDGAGTIGDSIGITGTRCTTMAGTIPEATRFITAMPSEREARGADSMANVEELAAAPMPATGLVAEMSANAVELTTVPAQLHGLSTETSKRPEATRNPAGRAVSAPVLLVATTMAGRPRPFRHAEAPAWVEVARGAAAVVGPMAVADLMAVAAVTGINNKLNRGGCFS